MLCKKDIANEYNLLCYIMYFYVVNGYILLKKYFFNAIQRYTAYGGS